MVVLPVLKTEEIRYTSPEKKCGLPSRLGNQA